MKRPTVRWMRLLPIVAACLGAPWSRADYGKSVEAFDNVLCWAQLSIPGITADAQPISGTNINTAASAGAGTKPNWIGDPVYDNALFYRAELRINGILIYEKTYNLGGGSGGDGPGARRSGRPGPDRPGVSPGLPATGDSLCEQPFRPQCRRGYRACVLLRAVPERGAGRIRPGDDDDHAEGVQSGHDV